jgi:hypothetical protein
MVGFKSRRYTTRHATLHCTQFRDAWGPHTESIRDKIVGFHDATRLATLPTIYLSIYLSIYLAIIISLESRELFRPIRPPTKRTHARLATYELQLHDLH